MTTPTTISDIADLYRIIDEHPHWREALRNQLLGAEILAMPEILAQLAVKVDRLTEVTAENSRRIDQLTETVAENSRQIAQLTAATAENSRRIDQLTETVAENSRQIAENSRQIDQLIEAVAENSRRIDQLTEVVAENSRRIDQLTEVVAENSRQIAELRRSSENQTLRMNRMESDIGDLKSMFTEAHPEETAGEIAELLGLSAIALTDREVLRRIAAQLQLPHNIRRSFTRADLVFQAQDRHGIVHWYAAEISWTVAPRDLERARRNAQLLEEATGMPAQAVVCGYRYEENMDWSGVPWLDLNDD